MVSPSKMNAMRVSMFTLHSKTSSVALIFFIRSDGCQGLPASRRSLESTARRSLFESLP